jgi:hypothetical protein
MSRGEFLEFGDCVLEYRLVGKAVALGVTLHLSWVRLLIAECRSALLKHDALCLCGHFGLPVGRGAGAWGWGWGDCMSWLHGGGIRRGVVLRVPATFANVTGDSARI